MTQSYDVHVASWHTLDSVATCVDADYTGKALNGDYVCSIIYKLFSYANSSDI